MADTESTTDARQRLLNAVDLLSRSLGSRGSFRQFDGDRKIDETLGYRARITFRDYLGRYERMGTAGAIVDRPAKTTWRHDPVVLEEDTDEETEFTEAVSGLARRTKLWSRAEQADRLAGIKNYAVMLIGSTRGERLEAPLADDGIEGPDDIGYFSVFRQDHAEITEIEDDHRNPRFGKPAMYRLTLFADRSGLPKPSVDRTQDVHWSRVAHVAEDCLEDDVLGRPRLERVFNDLDDMLKYTGSSAEMFWLQVAGILVAKYADDVQVDSSDMEDFEDDILDVLHKITRLLQVQGVDLEWLKPENTPDPTGNFDVSKQLLSAATGIPQRILFGSERGELASTQDEANWFGQIEERRLQHAEPVIVRPTIDRLIEVGALPEPVAGYRVEWKPLFQMSELQRAEVEERRARAIKALAEAFLAGGELAQEMAAVLVPDLAEVLEEGLRANSDFRAEEDEAAAREIERLLSEVSERSNGGRRRRRTRARTGGWR